MKWIHYTKEHEYLSNLAFISIWAKHYPIPKDKLHPQEIGMIFGRRIAVKKLTKKEREAEWVKHIKGIYSYLEEKGIPFVRIYKETKKKVMLCKFIGAELWVNK